MGRSPTMTFDHHRTAADDVELGFDQGWSREFAPKIHLDFPRSNYAVLKSKQVDLQEG